VGRPTQSFDLVCSVRTKGSRFVQKQDIMILTAITRTLIPLHSVAETTSGFGHLKVCLRKH
jgi:hypothetical protein